jgi:hypothetical protein
VRERTQAAALLALRQVDPQIRQALLQAQSRADPQRPAASDAVAEQQIFPTRLDLGFAYIGGAGSAGRVYVVTTAWVGYP